MRGHFGNKTTIGAGRADGHFMVSRYLVMGCF
jgi:hypothetical protein